MRLINGHAPHQGLVEMEVGGEWRIFCAYRNFDDDAADIVCRSMNYTGGLMIERGQFGHTNHTAVWVPYISCDDYDDKMNIFECDLILHTQNILTDRHEFWNNRYNNEFYSCLNKPNSMAAAVQCFAEHEQPHG
ncbi:uncharacterized protein LOC127855235 [Dreissena polymorpha]|uniref:uncharacterized protein LOC127855235 n=1 Tax=Dreissena polymorpha TaxID=45954 RepID=UPI00226480CE|nr:uncharacterized protein LOC127855235 [Dreissena polymorpha]